MGITKNSCLSKLSPGTITALKPEREGAKLLLLHAAAGYSLMIDIIKYIHAEVTKQRPVITEVTELLSKRV